MCGIVIDSLVLIFLLKTINDDDVGFASAFFVAVGTAIGTSVLAFALGSIMGIAGVVVATVVAAALLGVAVSALFGVEIKRSFLIGAIFMVVHIGAGIGFQYMMARLS